MPLVDLDDPEELRARWSALAAVSHATGFDRRWYADAGGCYHQDETGSILRLQRLGDGRAVLFGYQTQHSQTAGSDLLAGSPEWIGQPEVRQRLAAGELGFVYGAFNGTWARAAYEGDPWEPVPDGFLQIGGWITSEEDSAREMIEWVAEWADYLGGLDELLPAGIALIRTGGAITPEALSAFFAPFSIDPRSPVQPNIPVGVAAAREFTPGVAPADELDDTPPAGVPVVVPNLAVPEKFESGPDAGVGSVVEPGVTGARDDGRAAYDEESFVVPPGISPFTGQPIATDTGGTPLESGQPASYQQVPFGREEAPKPDDYGVVGKKQGWLRRRKQDEPPAPAAQPAAPALGSYVPTDVPDNGLPYNRLPSSEPPRVGDGRHEGDDFYASLFADTPATPAADQDWETAEQPVWSDSDATNEHNAFQPSEDATAAHSPFAPASDPEATAAHSPFAPASDPDATAAHAPFDLDATAAHSPFGAQSVDATPERSPFAPAAGAADGSAQAGQANGGWDGPAWINGEWVEGPPSARSSNGAPAAGGRENPAAAEATNSSASGTPSTAAAEYPSTSALDHASSEPSSPAPAFADDDEAPTAEIAAVPADDPASFTGPSPFALPASEPADPTPRPATPEPIATTASPFAPHQGEPQAPSPAVNAGAADATQRPAEPGRTPSDQFTPNPTDPGAQERRFAQHPGEPREANPFAQHPGEPTEASPFVGEPAGESPFAGQRGEPVGETPFAQAMGTSAEAGPLTQQPIEPHQGGPATSRPSESVEGSRFARQPGQPGADGSVVSGTGESADGSPFVGQVREGSRFMRQPGEPGAAGPLTSEGGAPSEGGAFTREAGGASEGSPFAPQVGRPAEGGGFARPENEVGPGTGETVAERAGGSFAPEARGSDEPGAGDPFGWQAAGSGAVASSGNPFAAGSRDDQDAELDDETAEIPVIVEASTDEYPQAQVEPHPQPGPWPQPTDPQPVPTPHPSPDPRPAPGPDPYPAPGPDPYPRPTPEPDPYPRPTPEPTPTPDPTPSPAPDPTPYPAPEPNPYPGPDPTPYPGPDPTPYPGPDPTPYPTPEPMPRPEPEPVPQPVPPGEPQPVPPGEPGPVPEPLEPSPWPDGRPGVVGSEDEPTGVVAAVGAEGNPWEPTAASDALTRGPEGADGIAESQDDDAQYAHAQNGHPEYDEEWPEDADEPTGVIPAVFEDERFGDEGAQPAPAAQAQTAAALAGGMSIPGLGLVGADGPGVELVPGSLEEAMRAEREQTRPRPRRSPAFDALHAWCRARTAIVPSGFTIQVQVLDPGAPSYRFDLEPPEVDDPEFAADKLSELLGDLWLTEAQGEHGGWLFARFDAAGRTLRIDRWYDQVPDWWDSPVESRLDVGNLARRLAARDPQWQPSYVEKLYTNAR